MNSFTQIIHHYVVLQAILAGALYPLAFAPFLIRPMAILAIAWLLRLLHQQSSPKQAFKIGIAFGVGQYLVGISWVLVSIHEYGNTDIVTAGCITLLFIMTLASIKGLVALSYSYIPKHMPKPYIFPLLWLTSEIVQSHIFTGFPWLLLGTTVLDTPWAGLLALLGIYGIGWLMVMLMILAYKRYYILLLIISGCTLLLNFNFTKPMEKFTVAIIQGNLKPNDKFQIAEPFTAVFERYLLPSLNTNANLIIWPENSVNVPFSEQKTFLHLIDNIFKNHHKTLIFGTQTDTLNNNYYNTLRMLGTSNGIYHKQALVPFGEYVPFEKYLRSIINFLNLPMSNFVAGPSKQPKLQWGAMTVAPLICYEISYPFITHPAAKDSNFIVNISEDGWFGDSLGPQQHLEIARVRALEAQKYIIRATTSGISAIIDAHGKVLAKTKQFEEAVLKHEVVALQGSTLLQKIGLGNILLIIILGNIFGCYIYRYYQVHCNSADLDIIRDAPDYSDTKELF